MHIRRRVNLLVLAVLGILALDAQASPRPPGGVQSQPAIRSRAEFDALARTTETPDAVPHVLFLIDRRGHNRLYYINSRRYKFHSDFVNGTYLSLERGQTFFENNYLKPNHRFILGTIAYRAPVRRWTFEFWEGDPIAADQIRLTSQLINASFFQRVAFKPNSLRQEEAAAGIPGLERVLERDIAADPEYQPLNLARAVGRLHIVPEMNERLRIGPDEILVLTEVPVTLPSVAGIITARPATPLSHINLLAASWGIPNAYVKDAQARLRPYDGQWVFFEAKRGSYTVRRATPEELRAFHQKVAARRRIMTPRGDLSVRRLVDLRRQRASAVVVCGAKSANLGEVIHGRIPDVRVPGGFTLPFFYYHQFMTANGLEQALPAMLKEERFTQDPAYRRERLAALRERIQRGQIDGAVRAAVLRRAHARFPGKGLFVRSSTNSEDLPNFIGAGLYTTVPNVRGDDQLLQAIRTVWASVWNFEAYEARERAGIDHLKVYMATLVQEGINADSAGVMITTDPYDRENRDAIYISAKRGLGIKVVEGKKVAEQLLFSPRTNAVQVLTRSAEDSLLRFDDRGGVTEVPITRGRAVLTDAVVHRLARAALRLKRFFGGRDQDIEWAYRDGRIYIVQSRPYIRAPGA